MNPKQVKTLHDGITIPEPAPERARQRDAYRVRTLICRVIIFGAPLLLLILMLDFLTLPNANGRYSGAAAWRDSVIFRQHTGFTNTGAYSSSMGVSWPIWYVEAWKAKDGWHAWTSGDAGGPLMATVGTPVVGWASGGSITFYLNQPDTRVGLWAASSDVLPEVWAMDPVTMSINPRGLPKEAIAEIRAAFVRAGGEAAGKAFDSSPVATFPGFGGRTLAAEGVIHNLLSLALFVAALICVVLWIPALRQHRRLSNGLCLRCGYDIRSVTLEFCPECSLAFGRTATYPGMAEHNTEPGTETRR